MRSKHFIILSLILIFLFFPGCFTENNTKKTEGNILVSPQIGNPILPHPQKTEGIWILTNYLDAILEKKSIAKVYKDATLSFYAYALYITKDSIYTSGSLYGYSSPLRYNNDTLLSISEFKDFVLKYDSENDKIFCIVDKEDDKLTFRRLNDENILSKHQSTQRQNIIKDNLYQIFIDSLIVGKYHYSGKKSTLSLNADGTMSGFKDYNRYSIHDYSGTSHPTYPYDAILFEDTISGHEDDALYNWAFDKNTLILTEMVTYTGGDSWVLGKKKYQYTKRK